MKSWAFGAASVALTLVASEGAAQTADDLAPPPPTPTRLAPAAPVDSAQPYEPAAAPRTIELPPDPTPATVRTWYGWQVLIVYGASVVLAEAVVGTRAEVVGLPLSLAGIYFGGLIVHAAHGNPRRGLTSLGLNVGLSLGAAMLGTAIACGAFGCSGEGLFYSVAFGGSAGAAVGLLAALIVDVSVLAYDERPAPPRARAGGARFAMAPDVRVTGEGATLGVAGRF